VGTTRAVDNDVLLKALRYGLQRSFWPEGEIGVLGAARYVVGKRLERAEGASSREALGRLLGEAEELEPEPGELELAAEIERRAADLGLELDGGESQLVAMVVRREMTLLETGDKRAIASLEPMVAEIAELATLCGRVRCLEQVAHRVSSENGRFPGFAAAICAKAEVDRSLSTCFSCYSNAAAEQPAVLAALRSYIEDLRSRAPSVLEPGPAP
jgi:hypothetical protein